MSIIRDGMKVFVRDQQGELVAQVYAPDDNAAGIAFQNQHALTLDRAINPQDYPAPGLAATFEPVHALQQCDDAIDDGNPPAAFGALSAYYVWRMAGGQSVVMADGKSTDIVAAVCTERFADDLAAICTDRRAS